MMAVDEARCFAEANFPYGPEKLAEHLGIEIREGPLVGCDGWVLSGPVGVLIRVNSKAPAPRRRFTLAHELSHLLLGIPTVVGESVYESLNSNDAEERRVNDLASELLLPESVVRQAFPSVPVVAGQLRKLAKKARVSELAVGIRVANLATSIGLVNASVAFFRGNELEWNWSKTLTVRPAAAMKLLEAARESHPEAARIPRPKTDDVIVASFIENPIFDSTTLFIQLLPAEKGNQLSGLELRRQLEEYLFENDDQFRKELQGVFGAFRPKCDGWTLDFAFAEFFRQKGERWTGTRRTLLNSSKGRAYVRLRLRDWCSE